MNSEEEIENSNSFSTNSLQSQALQLLNINQELRTIVQQQHQQLLNISAQLHLQTRQGPLLPLLEANLKSAQQLLESTSSLNKRFEQQVVKENHSLREQLSQLKEVLYQQIYKDNKTVQKLLEVAKYKQMLSFNETTIQSLQAQVKSCKSQIQILLVEVNSLRAKLQKLQARPLQESKASRPSLSQEMQQRKLNLSSQLFQFASLLPQTSKQDFSKIVRDVQLCISDLNSKIIQLEEEGGDAVKPPIAQEQYVQELGQLRQDFKKVITINSALNAELQFYKSRQVGSS